MTRYRSSNINGARIGGLLLIGIGLLVIGIVSGVILIKTKGDTGSAAAADGNINTEGFVVPMEVNFTAPSINLKNLKGHNVSFDDYRGKVILINNWATWCPPCKAEMPTLEAYYQAHQEEGFVLIGIDAGDPAADVEEFVNNHDLTFPIWLDPHSQALQAFKNYNLPNSYVIDKDFTVRLAWTGPVSITTLDQFVTPLIQE